MAINESERYSAYVQVLSASGLPRTGVFDRQPNALVELIVYDPNLAVVGEPHSTRAVRSTSPQWDRGFPLLDIDDAHVAQFTVFDRFARRRSLGEVQKSFGDLRRAADGNTEPIALPISGATLYIRFSRDTETQIASKALTGAADTAEDTIASPVSDLGRTVTDSLQGVIDMLQKLMDMGDEFAKIHPYVHAAWSTVTFVFRVVKGQLDQEAKILDLVTTMESLYTFVLPLQELKASWGSLHKTLEDVIIDITRQTVGCVYFIQEYSGHGFAGRTVRGVLTTANDKIDDYMRQFDGLASSLDSAIAFQTTLVNYRVLQDVEELVLKQRLNVEIASWSHRTRCHHKTRLTAIQTIMTWISGDGTNVLWLSGGAGSGKSTLAVTIADIVDSTGRLGAFIGFDWSRSSDADHPSIAIRSLAYQLSRFDKRIHDELVLVTTEYKHINMHSIDVQFRELIKRPLERHKNDISTDGPVVVVIDALDECGTEASRRELLQLLSVTAAELPAAIRIIITSRSTGDIATGFQSKSHIHHEDIEQLSDGQDIAIFIQSEMEQIVKRRHLPDGWPGAADVQALADQAHSLWIWAATVCKLLGSKRRPESLLTDLLAGKAKVELNDLYRRALQPDPEGLWADRETVEDFRTVLGAVAVAKDPLPPHAIDRLLGREADFSQGVVDELRAVLSQHGDGAPVNIHASFRHFICVDSSSEDPWFIDLDHHNGQLAEGCLAIMEETFAGNANTGRFCNLPLSKKPNSPDVLVHSALAYASSYWIDHVCDMKTADDKLGQQILRVLSHYSMQWLEVLSILKRSKGTAALLNRLFDWAKIRLSSHAALREFTADLLRFSRFFADTIAEHPSLVYLSALPFTPTYSMVYQQFHHGQAALPTVLGGYERYWSPSLRVLQTLQQAVDSTALSFHQAGANFVEQKIISLAFSHDSSKFASNGSGRGWESRRQSVLRVFDLTTGVETIPSVTLDGVATVAFSPDDTEIWAASEYGTAYTVRVATGDIIDALHWSEWSSQSDDKAALDGAKLFASTSVGASATEPGAVGGKAFLQSRSLIASTSDHLDVRQAGMVFARDNIRPARRSHFGTFDSATAWRIQRARQRIIAPPEFPEFKFIRAKFSRDGTRVAFGEEDGQLHIINILARKHACSPFDAGALTDRDGAERMFPSMDFSPDGLHLAAGSKPGSVYTLEPKVSSSYDKKVFNGHTKEVTVLQYSNDGNTLLSASEDSTVRIWDPRSTDCLRVVEFSSKFFQPLGLSPDQSQVVSTSENGTLQFWDISSEGKGEARHELEGHFNAVSAVAFSPDGSRLVSGAFLSGIGVWDVTMGNAPEKIPRHSRPPHKVEFEEDGYVVVSTRPGPQSMWTTQSKYWDTLTGMELKRSPEASAKAEADNPADVNDATDDNDAANADEAANANDTTDANEVDEAAEADKVEETAEANRADEPDEVAEANKEVGVEKASELDKAADADEAAQSDKAESSGSDHARLNDDTRVVFTNTETNEPWRRPSPGDSPFAHALISFSSDATERLDFEDGKIISAETRNDVWRVPRELAERCCAIRGNFLAFGLWNGRVITVYLPEELIAASSEKTSDLTDDGEK